MNKTPYTVLLLYPDYIASNYGEETYLAHVNAWTPIEAQKLAQEQIAKVHDAQAEDFSVLFVTQGHLEDETVR